MPDYRRLQDYSRGYREGCEECGELAPELRLERGALRCEKCRDKISEESGVNDRG